MIPSVPSIAATVTTRGETMPSFVDPDFWVKVSASAQAVVTSCDTAMELGGTKSSRTGATLVAIVEGVMSESGQQIVS